MTTTTHARARELTGWFPADVKPVHVGVYETDLGSAMERFGFSHWNGKFWGNQYLTADRAHDRRAQPGMQGKSWRGLSEEA